MLGVTEWGPYTTALVVGLVTLLLVKIWQTYQYLRTFKKLGIPGPTPVPVAGNAIPILRSGRDKKLIDILDNWKNQYGKVYGVFFPTPSIVVSDMDLARDVLVKKFSSFADRNEFDGFNDSESMRDNLLSLKGDHWKHVRSVLSPTFSSVKLKKVFPAVAKVAENLESRLDRLADSGEELELRDLCKCVGMDIIAAVAFGMEVNSINNPNDEFYKHGESMLSNIQKMAGLLFAFPSLAKLLSFLGFSMIPKGDASYLLTALDTALKDRREDTQRYNDFLQLLVEAQRAAESGSLGQEHVDTEIDFRDDLQTSKPWTRKGLTQSEMHANTLAFFLAGYETLTSVMSLTLFTLAAHPKWLQKVQAEVDAKLGDRPLTYEDAMNMTLIDMCMNETMRLHVPLLLGRQTTEEVDIGGYHVPKGMQVMIPALVFHGDPDIWPDPLTFNPERFTAEEKAKRHPFAFMPFGQGPRNCIGMRLAQLEIRMMIAAILRKYTPVLCPKSVYPPAMKPLGAVPMDGLLIKFEPRSSA